MSMESTGLGHNSAWSTQLQRDLERGVATGQNSSCCTVDLTVKVIKVVSLVVAAGCFVAYGVMDNQCDDPDQTCYSVARDATLASGIAALVLGCCLIPCALSDDSEDA